MKQRLRRILSILCILMLTAGCLIIPASAEDGSVSRVIMIEWDDEENYENLRPGSVEVEIEGGDPAKVVLSAKNDWTGESSAPSDAAWSLPELENYWKPVTSGSDVTIVTYTHNPAKTVVEAEVVWEDSENAAGVRPDSVQVRLLADGNPFRAAKTANEKNSWKVTWEDLPLNAEGGTTPIQYTAEQVENIESSYKTTAAGTTITNTLLTGSLSLNVTVAGVPAGADVSGLSLTVTGPQMSKTLTYGELAGGKADFGAVLPGAYLVQETNADSLIEGYVMDPANTNVGDAVYVKAGETKALNIKYTWTEVVPTDEINEDPLADAGKLSIVIDGPDPRMPMTITYADFKDGRYEINGLVSGEYVVIEKNAETLVALYTLTSDSVTGMTLTVGKDGTATAKLFNKYEPAPTPEPDAEEIDIPVVKIWNDNNNKDGNRPASITVNLYANGVHNETATITEADGWEHLFTAKPRYDEAGEEIEYTVDEEPVTWYTASINGTYITNNYTPEVTSASVQKVWNDDDNKQKIRPTSIAVTLLPVGEVYVLNEANGWSFVKNDLPTRINGEAVTYSWREQEAVGYTLDSMTTNGIATIFTNRIVNVPKVPANQPQPKTPGDTWFVFEEYDTALGIPILINHVGDCFD